MGWGKTFLLIQAILVLLIGLTFFAQLLVIEDYEFEIIKTSLNEGNSFVEEGEITGELAEIKQRYIIAAWLLPFLGLLEIIIVSRVLR